MLRSDKKKREQSNRRARHQWDGGGGAQGLRMQVVVEDLRFGQRYFLLPCRSRYACSSTLMLRVCGRDLPVSNTLTAILLRLLRVLVTCQVHQALKHYCFWDVSSRQRASVLDWLAPTVTSDVTFTTRTETTHQMNIKSYHFLQSCILYMHTFYRQIWVRPTTTASSTHSKINASMPGMSMQRSFLLVQSS
jgi:hypothetical protein